MNSENEAINDDEYVIKEEFLTGHIDYYDAVIRLTALLDDCDKAQAIIDGWDDEKNASEPKA